MNVDLVRLIESSPIGFATQVRANRRGKLTSQPKVDQTNTRCRNRRDSKNNSGRENELIR